MSSSCRMQQRSSHSSGGRPYAASNASAQPHSTSYFSRPSSDQECERNASTSPSAAGTVWSSCRRASSSPSHSAAKSPAVRLVHGTPRKEEIASRHRRSITDVAAPLPIREATAARERHVSGFPFHPSPSERCMRPRTRSVKKSVKSSVPKPSQ